MAEPNLMLGRISFDVTQEGIDEALRILDPQYEVSVSALDVGNNILGHLKMAGSLTLSEFRLTIADSKGSGSVKITPAFAIEYVARGGRSRKIPLDISFQTPQLGVNLKHEGSKAYLAVYLSQGDAQVSRPYRIPRQIWALLTNQLGRFSDMVKGAVNAQLAQRPIELFDLGDIYEFNLPNGKSIETLMHFEELEFSGSNLKSTVRVHANQ